MALVLSGLLGLPATGVAGTGKLVSQWMSTAPRVDGLIETAEWSAATLVDLGSGISVRIGNDGRTLYLSVLDDSNPEYTPADSLFLSFDDEGGTAPILDDGAWGNPSCQESPELGEGILAFYVSQQVSFQEITQSTNCNSIALIGRVRFASAVQTAGLNYEIAIPLDGPAPLRAGAGRRFGVRLQVYRDGSQAACLPSCVGPLPADFRNLVLASGGCNTGPQEFGSGDPLIGLPLDWTSEILSGSGEGWVQAPPQFYGDPVFCASNETGGAGGAACVSGVSAISAQTNSALRAPLPLAGQATASLRLRAALVVDPSQGENDLLAVDARLQDNNFDNVLYWQGFDQSATVTWPWSSGGSPPVELFIQHVVDSAGGLEGGFAQIDEVELLCGPILFADGFESGLSTHWSATTP